MPGLLSILPLIACTLVSACAYDNAKHLTYDALYNRQCIQEKGYANCGPDGLTYEEYEKERQELKNK